MTGLDRGFAVAGALLALLSVGAGAFGAHLLQGRLSTEMLDIFETAARYQMYHALALILTGVAGHHGSARWMRFSGWSFAAGIVLFCGSLYLLVASGQRVWGAVTPLGGLAFLAGWVGFAIGIRRRSLG